MKPLTNFFVRRNQRWFFFRVENVGFLRCEKSSKSSCVAMCAIAAATDQRAAVDGSAPAAANAAECGARWWRPTYHQLVKANRQWCCMAFLLFVSALAQNQRCAATGIYFENVKAASAACNGWWTRWLPLRWKIKSIHILKEKKN